MESALKNQRKVILSPQRPVCFRPNILGCPLHLIVKKPPEMLSLEVRGVCPAVTGLELVSTGGQRPPKAGSLRHTVCDHSP